MHTVNSLIDEGRVFKSDAERLLGVLRRIDSVFGFIFFPGMAGGDVDVARIEKLIQERLDARKGRNFKRADEIRDSLLEEGIVLEDTREGTRWKKRK
jgi:cysteinyl-tRNA synthetase